jgi:hypothetical protein
MRIPLYLAVAQWTLLLALGLLVIVMYRQLGRVLGRAKPAPAGPAAGSSAASFGYVRAGEDTVRSLTPGSGQPALLAFVDPTCPACERLVAALSTADLAGELDGLRVLLLISDPPSYLRISDEFRSTRLEIGRPATAAELRPYNASATPLLVAIDGAGVVRSAGPAAELAEIRAFVRACRLSPPDKTLGMVPGYHSAAQPEPAGQVPAVDRERQSAT